MAKVQQKVNSANFAVREFYEVAPRKVQISLIWGMRLVPEFATVVMFHVTGGVNARHTSRGGKGEQMKRISVFLTLPLLVALVLLSGYAGAAPAAEDVGYRDFSYDAASAVAPTGEKPQSKLWFNDGTWWGSLFNRSAEEHHIYRYDRASHTWSDTGTLIDERNSSKADVLWDGSHLYVATAGATSASSHSGRVVRYSYDAATRQYSRDSGFPVTVTSGGMEAIVLDKDTTGKLWVTYTQNNQVYVNHSLGSDQTWGTPFVLPVSGTTVSSDDISGIVAFDTQTAAPQIGVMWSNQVDDAVYFATHRDGDADNVWQGSRTAIQGPNTADDHISLRSLQADDVSGRVFAGVKTSLGDLPNPNPNAPLILLLVRGQDGSWSNYVFGRISDHHTRPIIMLDQEHRNLYMFAIAPETSGVIYYKKTSLSNISFSEGLGTPFIQSTTDTHINNATSTKQNVNSATGLLVLASDDTSKYYWHNFMDLGDADTVAPTVSSVVPTGGATNVATTANAEATFSEAMDASTTDGDPSTLTTSTFTLIKQGSSTPVAAQVSYDSASKKATLDPTSDLEANTTYTATIKGGSTGVQDLAGNALAQDYTWTFTTAAPAAPNCTITGTANAETISGTSADDVICAGGGNDTVKGLGGNDILKGQSGNDKLLGGVGDDTLDGEIGTDTASYSASLTAVTASLATNSATGEGSDTFLGVENLLGSSKADTLTGSETNNKLTGGGGPDTEQGGLGNDQVIGSGGADTLKGEDGDDAVNSKDGVNGNDSLDGGAGTDTKVTDTTEKSIVGFP